jgi:hypothetical protein
MNKSRRFSRTIVGLVFFLSVVFRVFADSLEVISTEPGTGGILATGECVKVSFKYELVSCDAANVGVNVAYGKFGSTYWSKLNVLPCCVTRGEGVTSLYINVAYPAVLDKVNLWIVEPGAPKASFCVDCPMNIRWVDKRFTQSSPNPVYDSAWSIGIPGRFPHASELYDNLASNGALCVSLYADRSDNRTWWTIKLGGRVKLDAAQSILKACLNCTTNIARIRIGTETGDSNDAGMVLIGGAEGSDFPPMSTNLVAELLSPDISYGQFRQKLVDWNIATARKKDEEMQERLRQRTTESTAVDDVYKAFQMESTVPVSPTNGLIAYYRFDKDAHDTSGLNGKVEVFKPKYVENSLYFESPGGGVYVHIPALRYERFTVSLDVKPLELEQEPGRHKRINVVIGGWGSKWFALDVADNGDVLLAFNCWRFVHEFQGADVLINDWNSLAFSLDLSRKEVLLCANGRRLPALKLPDDFVLDVIGSQGHEKEKKLSFSDWGTEGVFNNVIVDGGFRGNIRNLAVYDRAMSPDEMEKLQTAAVKSGPETPRPSPVVRRVKAGAPVSSNADQATLDKLMEAADGGNSEAQFQMAELCYRGTNRLVPIDNVKAAYWYLKAAGQNHAKAKQMLETIKTESLIPERDMAKARERLQVELDKK